MNRGQPIAAPLPRMRLYVTGTDSFKRSGAPISISDAALPDILINAANMKGLPWFPKKILCNKSLTKYSTESESIAGLPGSERSRGSIYVAFECHFPERGM